MAVSRARLAANRRNARKSAGPRTEAGKARAKLNTVKHGVRTATLGLPGYECRSCAKRLLGRGVEKLAPPDRAAARQVLLGIIDRATAQIEVKAADHRRRFEIVDTLAVDRLAFDDSPEGEPLRRYELSSGRAASRAFERLIKLRRSERPARDGCDDCAASEQPNVTNEATAIPEIATNEATAFDEANATNEATAFDEANATNEATAFDEANATNEATAFDEAIVTNEATAFDEADATNEATAFDEANATNEATAFDEANATNEATAIDEANATNEATAFDEANVTNEATAIDDIVTNEATPAAQTDFSTGEPGLDYEEAGGLP